MVDAATGQRRSVPVTLVDAAQTLRFSISKSISYRSIMGVASASGWRRNYCTVLRSRVVAGGRCSLGRDGVDKQ